MPIEIWKPLKAIVVVAAVIELAPIAASYTVFPAAFGRSVAASTLRPWGVSRQALSHFRFLEHFINFLQGREARLPVSIADVLPTIELLGALAAAVYQPYREEPVVFATLSARNAC